MKKTLQLLTIITMVCLASCKNNSDSYPVEKQVWEITDYEDVTREIRFGTPEGEKYPGFNERQDVFLKLTDVNNVAAILDDNSLGIQYRQEYSEKLFNVWKDLVNTYSKLDRQDNYIYPSELVKVRDWGYYIQIKYFSLGNQEILQSAVNPEDVKSTIRLNEQTVIDNFVYGITFLTDAHALSNEAIDEYSKVIKERYTELIRTFPSADYTQMKQTIEDISKKIKSENLKSALEDIKEKIESLNNNTENANK